jgi:hypothetical protein
MDELSSFITAFSLKISATQVLVLSPSQTIDCAK